MENASKALIIAGAILLAILIIGLGMMVFSGVRERVSDTSSIDEVAAQAYNSPYEAYFGTSVSSDKVKALLDKINTHNITTKDDSLKIKVSAYKNPTGSARFTGVSVNPCTESTDLTAIKSQIEQGKTYVVRASTSNNENRGYSLQTGYLNCVVIRSN